MTGSNDQCIKLFSLSEKKFRANYLGHNNWVKNVRFSPDVWLIVSGSDDNTVKIWDVNEYCVITIYIDHLQPVNSLRWSLDVTCIASCSNDKKIKIFDIRSGRIIEHYDAHSAPVTSLSYHTSGKYLVSSSFDSIWDIFNSQFLYTLHGHQGPVNSVILHSQEMEIILFVVREGITHLWYEKIMLDILKIKKILKMKDCLYYSKKELKVKLV